MKLNIYELMEKVDGIEITFERNACIENSYLIGNEIIITIAKQDYMIQLTFIQKIKKIIDYIEAIPSKIYYNKEEIKIHYNEDLDIGFD